MRGRAGPTARVAVVCLPLTLTWSRPDEGNPAIYSIADRTQPDPPGCARNGAHDRSVPHRFVVGNAVSPERLSPAALAAAASTDPHLAWLAEWQEIQLELDGQRTGHEELMDRGRQLEDLIANTPPTSTAGALAIAALIVSSHEMSVPSRPASAGFFFLRLGDVAVTALIDATPQAGPLFGAVLSHNQFDIKD